MGVSEKTNVRYDGAGHAPAQTSAGELLALDVTAHAWHHCLDFLLHSRGGDGERNIADNKRSARGKCRRGQPGVKCEVSGAKEVPGSNHLKPRSQVCITYIERWRQFNEIHITVQRIMLDR